MAYGHQPVRRGSNMKRRSVFGAILVAAWVAVLGVAAQAQPPGGGPGGRPGGAGGFGGGGFGGPGGGSLGLLIRSDVQAELELLDDQLDQLTKLREGMVEQFRQLMSQDQDLSPQERMQRAREAMEKARQDLDQKVKQILLPHQQKRLEQLGNQMQMRGGILRGLTNPQMAEELKLTQAQQDKIRAKAEQLEAELRQKMAELRSKAQEELLKELTPAQQAQLKERFGEPFDFQGGGMPQFGQGGPGPGGFGPGGGGRPDAAPETGEQQGRGRRGFRPQ
jgi:Spy/CpxP family protein refolding chaperone